MSDYERAAAEAQAVHARLTMETNIALVRARAPRQPRELTLREELSLYWPALRLILLIDLALCVGVAAIWHLV